MKAQRKWAKNNLILDSLLKAEKIDIFCFENKIENLQQFKNDLLACNNKKEIENLFYSVI